MATYNIDVFRKKVTKAYEYASCSYHEAGHTIYALLHLSKVNSVSVFENKKPKRIYGFTSYEYSSHFEDVKDPELFNILVKAELGISYSGLIAEKILFRSISGSRRIPKFILEGSSDDHKCAREIINKYNLAPAGQRRNSFKSKLIKEVQDTLQFHWEAVTLVSHALYKHHRLHFLDLQNILTKKSVNKKFWKEQFKKINTIHNGSSFSEKELKHFHS